MEANMELLARLRCSWPTVLHLSSGHHDRRYGPPYNHQSSQRGRLAVRLDRKLLRTGLLCASTSFRPDVLYLRQT